MNFKGKSRMMEDGWRRLNIVWISSHFHLDDGGRALVARPSFPLQLFPSNGRSARDGCRYVAIEALFLRGEIGLRLFPLLLPLTRDSLPSRLITCPVNVLERKKKKKKKYDMCRYKRSDNYHTLKIREASLHYTEKRGEEKRCKFNDA